MPIVPMEPFGFLLFKNGIVFHSDCRKRLYDRNGKPRIAPRPKDVPGVRGKVRGYSEASRRRFEFRLMNLGFVPSTIATLTYHAVGDEWSSDSDRNAAFASKGKDDLHRFLACLRKRDELGPYLWVQEFQERGVVHFHIVCERELSEARVKEVWFRIIGAEGDPDALRYGVKVEPVREDRKVRSYLSTYLGKGAQKSLPVGVDGAGRWWGLSRSAKLALVDTILSGFKEDVRGPDGNVRVVRGLRRYLSRLLGFKFKGGGFVVWKDATTARVVRALEDLRRFYGVVGAGFILWDEEFAWRVREAFGVVEVRAEEGEGDAA